jgi:hypothetical protein
MILYLRDPKDSTIKLLEIINPSGKGAGYKTDIQNSVAFLYSNNTQTEKELRETIPFTIASKTIKYLGINLTKETKEPFNENLNHQREKLKKTSEDRKIFHAHGSVESTL